MQVLGTGFNSATGIQIHSHNDSDKHEFHYYVEGRGTFWNDGVEMAVEPGALFLSAPGEAHGAAAHGTATHGAARPEGRFQLYWLLFSASDDPDGLLPRLRSRFDGGAKITIGKGQSTTFEDIRRRWTSSDPLSRRSADYRFATLLCDLVAGPRGGTNVPVHYIEEAMGMMQATLHEPVDLRALSAHLGIDKAYFVRLFKRHVGVPPMRYFLDLRLDSAKHRLMGGDESLRTIALDLGFHDEFHFSHQFKAHVGVSPQAFKAHPGA
ncbi:MAG: AraC family transcriptional regulator [Spirochaetales bacterium]